MAVICGIDRIDEYADVFRGKRLGLATGASGIGRDYRSSVDILKDKCDLRALFAPEHGVRGDTASNVQKNAVLETGFRIQVPLFVNEGDMIRVDTRTGEYIGRCK